MFERLGFRTSGLRHLPIKEVLRGISHAGYQTVEFCLEHPGSSGESLKSVEKHGLEVSAVSYHGKRDPMDVRLKQGLRAIELAAEHGLETVVLGSPLAGEEGFIQEAEMLYEQANRKGIRPAWETEPGTILDSLEDFRSMIIPLGTAAGLNLDAGHLHLQGSCTAGEIASLKDRIHHVHVEGMTFGTHVHLIPGKGDVNWPELFSGLMHAGYDKSLTIDLFDIPPEWESFISQARIALTYIISYYLKSIQSNKRG